MTACLGSSGRVLIVTAVAAEARAVGAPRGAHVIAGGVGRTNAAAATTEAILVDGPFDLVVSAGVAGALPGGDLELGAAVLASACVYAEEGLVAPDGFSDITAIGFPLGDFEGNRVPVDEGACACLAPQFRTGVIATVATCSGTDDAARSIAARTGAIAEAMEGAAVVHAARRLGHRAIELRTISNDTGDRPRQRWDLRGALEALGPAVTRAIAALRGG